MSNEETTNIYGMNPTWIPGIVTAIHDSYEFSHRIYFKSPKIFDETENIAIKLGEASKETKVGDFVMILNMNPQLNNLFYYVPVLIDNYNKVEMYSGIKGNNQKTNHIDLTYGGIDGENSTKEIYIKSDNKITIDCGPTQIIIDGATGNVKISAIDGGIDILGNVKVHGGIVADGDVKALGGQYSLTTHQHFGALAYPITPPYPSGAFELITQ